MAAVALGRVHGLEVSSHKLLLEECAGVARAFVASMIAQLRHSEPLDHSPDAKSFRQQLEAISNQT